MAANETHPIWEILHSFGIGKAIFRASVTGFTRAEILSMDILMNGFGFGSP